MADQRRIDRTGGVGGLMGNVVGKRPFLPVVFLLLIGLACNLLPVARPPDPGAPLVVDAPQLRDAPAETGRVVDVVDGDTIHVVIDGEEFSVRYVGIDTPERDQLCYEDATAVNAAYVAGEVVRLVRDTSDTDRYGRLLRYVYVDEVLVNAELVAGGWADAKRYPPDTRLADFFVSLEADARGQDLGCYPTGIFTP